MSIEILTSAILRQMPRMTKWQHDFFVHVLGLYLSLRGRYNFLNMERYGRHNELTYRNHFQAGFDFKTFNLRLILAHTGSKRLNVFDPSFVCKSGKHTPGVGYFWSGTASKAKWGLELCGFATVDVEQNTALHFSAAQTIAKAGQSLMDFYIQQVFENASDLLKTSRYLGVDAFFSKKNFVDAALKNGLDVISRLRHDAVLHYAAPERRVGQRGRPRKYGERFKPQLPDETQLPCVLADEKHRIFGGNVWVKSLGRLVRVAIVHKLDGNGKKSSVKIYFCTDLLFPILDIWLWYKSRFQIEFLFRDAKQFVGLENCQSRKTEALNYHFNMALTAVSVAKVACHLNIDKNLRGAFSMADVKTQHFNQLLLDRIFHVFANVPNIQKNHSIWQNIINLGKIAA
jgi:hypothetical protein